MVLPVGSLVCSKEGHPYTFRMGEVVREYCGLYEIRVDSLRVSYWAYETELIVWATPYEGNNDT